MNLMNLNWRVGVAFGAGVAAGIAFREAARLTKDTAERKMTHRERERTVSYDQNLPEPLERREPAPHEGQPRFGGTGAIGFSPAAAANPSDT